ncbi:inositol monophosphatase family protein [Rhizosaccharibacter radicis]|uniref:Inositol monophosphatase n=1 Tax=Rhizosaccharibacter radicis TaxID=2782605 RepID=A0ABT1W1Q6_9PROT|nr:inositol monophosphatase [Acetobacteraceae bacterium KSS12]
MNASTLSGEIERRFDAAHDIIREAAALAMRMRPPPGAPVASMKGAQDWVTEADRAVEALVAERIGALFPADGFQGEEGGRQREGTLRWIVDPIDGTSNFARGRERWCVSLGLFENERPVAGLLLAPVVDELFAARRGGGATLNGRPIKASPAQDLHRSMIEIGWGPTVPMDLFLSRMQRAMVAGAMPRSGGSGALALADVACGRLDGYLELAINLWDVAGALPILHEAGARVSPFLRVGGLRGPAPILAAAPGLAVALGERLEMTLD